MSAEEPEPTTEAPATTEETAPSNGEDTKKNGKERKPRDETPIEDLYDLTQPIPRVDKPDKATHDTEVAEINAKMDSLKEDRKKVQEKIDEAMNDPESKKTLTEARTKMKGLKSKKDALIQEKKAIRDKLNQAKNQKEKLIKDKKDAKTNVKFSSVDKIDEEINRLKRKQETTTMTLNEEKKLIKEMDALKASKRFVADIKDKDAAIDGTEEQRKTLSQQINAKDKEIDVFTKEIGETMEIIKAVNAKEEARRGTIQDLFKEREDIKKKMDETAKERDSIRSTFREKNNAWYNYQRAIRAQKKMQYEEEKAKREAERAEYEAKIAAEEAKKIPYEEEQALCEYLAMFLERTYLGKSGDDKSEKKSNVIAVKDDPFAGMKPVKKDEVEYFGKGKGKKKRNRGVKKQDAATGPFTLSVDMFDQFGLVQLSPPTKLGEVEASVKALREKKDWYKQQERGSVPTAQEIRKMNEKAANKLRQETVAASTTVDGEGPKKKSGAFSLSNDDFVPLGVGAAAASVNSSWGKTADSQEAS